MGLKTSDVLPSQVTATTPASKDVQAKAFQIARTDTVASVKAVLPADASIIDIEVFGVASNAGTTATVNVGSTSAATEFINGQDVKTAGGKIRPTTAFGTAIPNLESLPLGADIQIYAKYAETGAASSAGGPYTVVVSFVR
jgi:hypothetical protein